MNLRLVPDTLTRKFDSPAGPRDPLFHQGESVPADEVVTYDRDLGKLAFVPQVDAAVREHMRAMPKVGGPERVLDWTRPLVITWSGGRSLVRGTHDPRALAPAGFEYLDVCVVHGRIPGPASPEEARIWASSAAYPDRRKAVTAVLRVVRSAIPPWLRDVSTATVETGVVPDSDAYVLRAAYGDGGMSDAALVASTGVALLRRAMPASGLIAGCSLILRLLSARQLELLEAQHPASLAWLRRTALGPQGGR